MSEQARNDPTAGPPTAGPPTPNHDASAPGRRPPPPAESPRTIMEDAAAAMRDALPTMGLPPARPPAQQRPPTGPSPAHPSATGAGPSHGSPPPRPPAVRPPAHPHQPPAYSPPPAHQSTPYLQPPSYQPPPLAPGGYAAPPAYPPPAYGAQPYAPPPQYPPPGYAPAPLPPGGYAVPPGTGPATDDKFHQAVGFVATHGRRAVARDLRAIAVTPYEEPRLDAIGVKALTVRQYLVWRRSWLYLSLPIAFVSMVFHLVALFDEEQYKPYTALGAFMVVVVTLAQAAGYPVAAALATVWWDRHKLSRWVLLGGVAVSFVFPILFTVLPLHWFVELPAGATGQELALQKGFIGLVAGVGYGVTILLPTVLALIPGVLRACTRIKSLLPESIVPGWFLVLSAPFYAMVLLLAFIVVNQVAGNLLLILGMLLLMAAPAVYLTRTPLFIRPIHAAGERRQLDQLQGVYVGVVGLAALFLLIYLFTVEVFGHPLVGTKHAEGTDTTGLPPGALIATGTALLEVIKFLFTYVGKSMFITAVSVDLFMLVNLSVWRNTKAFAGTPEAAAYDELMGTFGRVAEGKAGTADVSAAASPQGDQGFAPPPFGRGHEH